MLKRLILIIKSNNLMLNPRMLLTLAFKKMLYDNSRKTGNPVPPAPLSAPRQKKVKKLHKGLFSLLR